MTRKELIDAVVFEHREAGAGLIEIRIVLPRPPNGIQPRKVTGNEARKAQVRYFLKMTEGLSRRFLGPVGELVAGSLQGISELYCEAADAEYEALLEQLEAQPTKGE